MIVTILRELFLVGDLTKASVVPAPMERGWNVSIDRKSGESVLISEGRAPRKTRVFKGVGGALSAVRKVGFGEATVYFEKHRN